MIPSQINNPHRILRLRGKSRHGCNFFGYFKNHLQSDFHFDDIHHEGCFFVKGDDNEVT